MRLSVLHAIQPSTALLRNSVLLAAALLTMPASADVPTHSIRFTITQADQERWPAEVTIIVNETSTASERRISLEPRVAFKPQAIGAADGSYALTFTAAHHRPMSRTVRVHGDDVDLGSLTMIRLPMLQGTVKTASGAPVDGAFITDGSTLSARTDALGMFRLEVEREWPAHLLVTYPGLATKELTVPKTESSFAFPPITLSKGGVLALDVEGVMGKLSVDLRKETGYQKSIVLQTARLTDMNRRAEFSDVEKGEYFVVVKGEQALQRVWSSVSIGEGDLTHASIRIEPLIATIQLRRGDAPVAAPVVTVMSDEGRWTSDIQVAADGEFKGEMWQRGTFVFAVKSREDGVPILLLDEVAGKDEATVRLSLPDRRLAGRVVEAESGQPIERARVVVESNNDDGTGGNLAVFTGSDDRFSVDTLRDGRHEISGLADGYLISDPAVVRIDQTSPERDVTLRLAKGNGRAVRVTTRGRVPIRQAFVMAAAGGKVVSLRQTDETGRATIGTPPDQSAVLYVIPREGSFAVLRLPAEKSSTEQVIVVPNGDATLELHATTVSGKPLQHVAFAMRYDGEFIPEEVSQFLERQRGIAPVTDADGVVRMDRLPAGFLELWPISGAEHADVLSAGVPAPVQVSLKEGLTVATMTFVRK